MEAIPTGDLSFAAVEGGPVKAGDRMPFVDPRKSRHLRWLARALITLRVMLVLILIGLILVMWNWPWDEVPAAIDSCFAQHEDVAGTDAMIALCLRGTVVAASHATSLMRASVLSLIALLAMAVPLSILARTGYRKLLQDQSHFEQQLFDALPLPVSLRSPSGRFMHVNKAFELKYGFSREELLGKPVGTFFSRADEPAWVQLRERALKTDEPVEHESTYMTLSGLSHVQARLRALRRVDGSLIGFLAVLSDVTALRRKEAELIESNARLKQLSAQLLQAQEQERRRIARDLHDDVGQILTGLKLQLRSLAQRESMHGATLATPIDLAEEALRHTRDLSTSLHPHLLDDLGLQQALNWLIDRFIRPSVPTADIACKLSPARGDPKVELVAFRVVQEALTNVVRHAQATRVGVILEAALGGLSIEVIDDGIGFDGAGQVDLLRTTSLGLTAMYERVSECGGHMRIDSTRGVGTSLRVRLPWKKKET